MKYIEILSEVRENVKKISLVFGEWKIGTFENNYSNKCSVFRLFNGRKCMEAWRINVGFGKSEKALANLARRNLSQRWSLFDINICIGRA